MPEPVYTKFLPAIEDALREHWSISLAQSPAKLKEMIAYHMGWRDDGTEKATHGKRIRPALVLLVVDACGKDWIHALPAAVAVEYLHNFSLIHDDIQDNSHQRHGREALWTLWGIPQAINTGDSMFTLAYLALLNSRQYHPDTLVGQLVMDFSQTCLKLTEGQHQDMLFEKQEHISEAEYLTMVSGKTAALLGCCVAMGGILGARSLRQVDSLRRFGINLGLAFQIQDDILGIWGDQGKTGKSSRSDLANGKKSLPILHALENSTAFKTAWLADHTSSRALKKLMEILIDTGSRAYAQSLVNTFTHSANEALGEAFQDQPTAMDKLAALSMQLLNRES